MKFKVQLVLVTEICFAYAYLLLLNSHFFWKQPSGSVVGGGHSGGVCSESAGEMHFGMGVLLSACCTFLECCFLRTPLEAGLLLLFLCLV